MTDNSKFQDGGFLPKEVFIEAREKRKVKWLSTLSTRGNVWFEYHDVPHWKATILNKESIDD